MNYIVLDLEWDSGFHPKYKRFINQILQIGAVKLNESLELVDSFEICICSEFTKRVSGRFARLTGITTQKMREGVPAQVAVKQYNEWAGKDIVTMTWSNSDLFAIKENEELLLDGERFYIEKYIDLQRYIQDEMARNGADTHNQISLADAAALFDISTDEYTLHTARDDSLVCVRLLQKTFNEERFSAFIKDTRDPQFYKRLCFKPYYINDINDPLVDRSELKFCCEQCGKELKRISKWKYRNRNFSATHHCNACEKNFCARISFRKNYDNVVVKKRLTLPKVREEVKDEVQSVSAQV